MGKDFFDERKVKSNDIVNGVARRDIYDGKGLLLVKEGRRIGELHYQRMREDGLIQEELLKDREKYLSEGINYVGFNSLHGKLQKLISKFGQLQRQISAEPDAALKEPLKDLASAFAQMCDENIYQVLGELHLTEVTQYNTIKPLYFAASLLELIKRYNWYKEQQAIQSGQQNNLLYAALLINTGLLQMIQALTSKNPQFSTTEKQQVLANYRQESLNIMQKTGFSDGVCIDVLQQLDEPFDGMSIESRLFKTAFTYADMAMPPLCTESDDSIMNPCREFAKLFAQKKLDPLLGGLFLKINGLVPVGSMLLFDSREKALVVRGPEGDNIKSSKLRMLTYKSGLQLKRPGESFFLNKTKLVQKGLVDHHQFAWSTFAPFTMWER